MRFLWFPAIVVAAALISGCESAVAEPLDFSKTNSIDEEWHHFSERLAVVIADLHEHDFLILSEKKRNVYIQFASGGRAGIRVEAVSEQFFPDLDKEDKMNLDELGWSPPTYILGPKGEKVPGGSCNYSIDPDKMSSAKLADLVVRTFCLVYHTPHPGDLQYRAFHAPNTEMRFPTLGLELAPDPAASVNSSQPKPSPAQ
jgi:hypothetical protein